MKQIIQSLHSNSDMPKGFLTDMVANVLNTKLNTDYLSPLEDDLFQLINHDKLSADQKNSLVRRLGTINLLSNGIVNPKTAKTLGLNVSNWILHLTPSNLSGFNICPSASKGCRASCLNGAGRGLFDGVQLPRLRKTLYFVYFRREFLDHLDKEISQIEKRALKTQSKVIVRLNGTSDISWELFRIRMNTNIFDLHPNVTFYDYTKVFTRLGTLKLLNHKNYSVTFSASETNSQDCIKALNLGFNVAVVFDTIPLIYKKYQVINGDEHDFRFLDKTANIGYVIGLKAKGPAKRDNSGFVRRLTKKVG